MTTTTITRSNSGTKFTLILGIVGLLLIVVGGRTFDKLELTDHWINDHPECKSIKMDAISPESGWRWENTPRGQCAFYRDTKTASWIVIILIVVKVGRKRIIRLITGYKPDENDPNKWLRRSANRR